MLHEFKINVRQNQRGNQKIYRPEKLATMGKQDTRRRQKKYNTICVGHHYAQPSTNNINKTLAILQNN